MAEDLELLLSLQDEEIVPRSPPTYGNGVHSSFEDQSASAAEELQMGYHSDEEPKTQSMANMSFFKNALNLPTDITENQSSKKVPTSQIFSGDIERHSGLRIRDMAVSALTLGDKLSDLRFIRLQGLKNAMFGDGIKGAWATVAVIAEKTHPKVASNGKNYVIWKLTSLESITVSIFLFGNAYSEHWKESPGTAIALFDAQTRRGNSRDDITLSIFNRDQLMVVGKAADFGICKGKKKDDTGCAVVVNRKHSEFCKFHATASLNKFRSKRPELSGGNLFTGVPRTVMKVQQAFVAEAPVEIKPLKRAKHLPSSELSKTLSNGDKVTPKTSSQGLRFLASMAENTENQTLPTKQKKSNVERHALSELNGSNGSRKRRVMELDMDDPNDALVQAMSIFNKS